MPIRQKQIEEIRAFGGQKSGLPPRALNPQDSELIYNFSNIDGILYKINGGVEYFKTVLGTSAIKWLGRFNNRWMWQVGSKIGIEQSEDSATELTVTEDFTSEKIFSDKWRDNIFLANGKRFSFYGDDGFKDVGILPPGGGAVPRTNAPIVTTTSGSKIAAGARRYAFVVYDSDTGTESLPWGSLPDEKGLLNTAEYDADTNPNGWLTLDVTTSGTVGSINIKPYPMFDSAVPLRGDKLRVYRTKIGDTSSFFFVADFDIGIVASATAFQDNKADIELGAILITAERQPPPQRTALIGAGFPDNSVGIKYLRQWRDSLLAVGVEFERTTVTDAIKSSSLTVNRADSFLYASDPFQYDYWPFNFEVGRGDGQKLVGVAVIVDIPLIFKSDSTYMLVGDNVTNAIPRRIDSQRGCVNASTLQETPIGAICLSGEGFILARPASETQIISSDISDVVDDINFDKLDNADSSYDRVEGLYYCMFPTGGATTPNKTLTYDIRSGQWSTQRKREGTAIHFDVGSNSKPRSLVGASSGGQLVDIGDATNVTHLGSRITGRWRSGQFSLGDPSVRKKVKWLYVLAEANEAWTIDVRVFSDLFRGTVYEATSIDSTSNYAVYGTDKYGTGRYVGGKVRELLKVPVEGVGRLFQVEIVHNSTDTKQRGFSLLSVQLEGVVMGL